MSDRFERRGSKTEALRRFVEFIGEKRRLHLALGGSYGTKYKTPLSDLDLFVVADTQRTHAEVKALLLAVYEQNLDIEFKLTTDLDSLLNQIGAFEPSIDGGLPPFDFGDLRFLSRLLCGQPIVTDRTVAIALAKQQKKIREASACYFSSVLLMKYQDALGLFMENRHTELLLISGELAQYACLVSLLQSRLVDLAPKWAPHRAADGPASLRRDVARALLKHIGEFGTSNTKSWSGHLLELINGIVAAGKLEELETSALEEDDHPRGVEQNFRLCPMGVPGYLTVADVVSGKTTICNSHFLRALVASALNRRAPNTVD